MENTYLVGGAVRDKLLKIPTKDRDWVVTGSTPDKMLAKGFKSVGKDFPVFLHPKTHEEYALARTERKTAPGYQGFVFHADPDVTLEQDLSRRDLTINAIAEDLEGNLIDPFNGQADLKNKIFRHVTDAFSEDPVRILRVARFASRFPDFTVAPETLELMQKMVANHEVGALVAERVWQEWSRALTEQAPQRFFEVLNDAHALKILFPELILHVDEIVARLQSIKSQDLNIRFSCLMQTLNDEKHIKAICKRYRTPKPLLDLTLLTNRYYPQIAKASQLSPEELLTLLEACDPFRRLQRFNDLLICCETIAICEKPDSIFHPKTLLEKIVTTIKDIPTQPLIDKGLSGIQIKDELCKLRLKEIKRLIHE